MTEPQSFGAPLPDFELADLSGVTRRLDAALSGKRGGVVVFWSGVCSHCVRYDEHFNAFSDRHRDLAFVAVASRFGESVEDLRRTADARGLTFTILHDPGSLVARKWLTQQTPRAFLMDAGRRLVYRGAIDNYKYPDDPDYEPYLEPAIEAMLAGRPVPRAEVASFGCAIETVYYLLRKPV